MTLLLVLVGGAAGALLRWAAGLLIGDRGLPWPTVAVNIIGAFLLGLLTALPAGPALTALLGTGLCGALTTWSALAYQSTTLSPAKALLNMLLTITAGVTAVWLGASLG